MPLSIKHLKQSEKSDGQDDSLLQPTDWNAAHVFKTDAKSLVGNSTSSEGPVEPIHLGDDFELEDGNLNLTVALGDIPLLVYSDDPDNPSKARILTESATIDLAGSPTAITASVKDDSITLAKMEHGVAGSMLFYNENSTPVGAPARLGSGSLGTVLVSNGLSKNPSWEYAGGPHCVLIDEKPNGTDGGTFTAAGWRDRVINVQVFDPYHLVTFAGNIFTLGIGTWTIEWSAPARACNSHQTRLLNNTATAHPFYMGSSELAPDSNNIQSRSVGIAQVVHTVATGYKIQHYCTHDGTFGQAVSATGGTEAKEVYTIVKIWKTA